MKATLTNTKMTDLFDNPIFNTGGWATIMTFFGLNVADVNLWLTFIIGILSIGYLVIGGYLRFLQAAKAKKEAKAAKIRETNKRLQNSTQKEQENTDK